MPERADEATMLSDDIRDDTRTALLAKAAALWADGGPGRGGAGCGTVGTADDRFAFLTAYYRLVALEDLIAAGPDRLAETAARQAALGATRPQGRPVVGVRPAQSSTGVSGSLTAAGTVVDIVTDDMPYLVDSVTMELNRHAANIRLIVHPMLVVRRDVAGTAHAIAPAGDGPSEARPSEPAARHCRFVGPRRGAGRRRIGPRVVDPRRARPGSGRAAPRRRPAPCPR